MKSIKEISTRLEIAKKNLKKNKAKNNSSNAASLGKALKISTELVAAVVVGSTIGFILDNWFDTKPWLTIIFFFYGCNCRHFKCNKICKENAEKFQEIMR